MQIKTENNSQQQVYWFKMNDVDVWLIKDYWSAWVLKSFTGWSKNGRESYYVERDPQTRFQFSRTMDASAGNGIFVGAQALPPVSVAENAQHELVPLKLMVKNNEVALND